jgi:Mn2+/Fe2+ NRAMP family transporter
MNSGRSTTTSGGWFQRLAPGILIAATGVGAGDLITASIAGSRVGLTILWAVLVGAVLKWVLNEGLARWQMATGTTLLEGWVDRLGGWVQWVFLLYLIPWTLATGAALMTACGAAGAAVWQLGLPFGQAKVVWGVVHALVGLVLVWVGGFRLFEKVMSVCIAVMFVAVMVTAVMIGPDWAQLGRGLVIPQIADFDRDIPWVLGLLGGVGGSVTLLSYGYWVREQGRSGAEGVSRCRLDLAVGYAMTALFGIAMVTIGSRLTLAPGKSDRVALELADQLAGVMGASGQWVFLIGFWGAVFSSLLGVVAERAVSLRRFRADSAGGVGRAAGGIRLYQVGRVSRLPRRFGDRADGAAGSRSGTRATRLRGDGRHVHAAARGDAAHFEQP